MRGYKLFSGTANLEFSKQVAKHLTMTLSEATISGNNDSFRC